MKIKFGNYEIIKILQILAFCMWLLLVEDFDMFERKRWRIYTNNKYKFHCLDQEHQTILLFSIFFLFVSDWKCSNLMFFFHVQQSFTVEMCSIMSACTRCTCFIYYSYSSLFNFVSCCFCWWILKWRLFNESDLFMRELFLIFIFDYTIIYSPYFQQKKKILIHIMKKL